MNAIDATQRASGAAARDPAAGDAADGRAPRILVVDDVPDNREVLTRRLQRRGFEVVEAGGGNDALAAVEREDFDVILLDIMMPDLSGNDVLKKIRETRNDFELPVIMVSAKSQSEDVVESLELGANDYVTKPVDFAVAMARINAQLARKRLAEQERTEKQSFAAKAANLSQTVETLRRTSQSLEEELRQRRQSEERLHYMAFHDGLTGLLNRTAFRERLGEAIASASAGGHDLALLFIDLDRFKAVNDVHGHEAGDKLLVHVAGRLTEVARPEASVARLGGDEFAVLLAEGTDHETGEAIAHDVVQALGRPFGFDEQTFQVGASCGIAWLSDCEGSFDLLMKGADLSMYRAKHGGRARHVVYERRMLDEQRERSTLEVDLRRAIEEGSLELRYQPLINAKSQKITSFEALLRWPHPTRGMIMPDDFIPLAEETGLIIPLGAWVLPRACQEAAGWPAEIRVAVNLSPLQFRDENLMPTLLDALETSGLDPRRLEVEITELALLKSGKHNFEILSAIRKLGVRVSMDDFGTGYSSMAYLQQFEFDKIKIDRRFVDGLARGPNSAAIIKAIVHLGTNIGIETTAEGIESEDQLVAVTSHGCTELQGYYFSRPLRAADAQLFLSGGVLPAAS